MKRRVVITGMGVSTPVGRILHDFWANLLAGRSGVSEISLFNAASFPVRIGGEVKQLPIEELARMFPEAVGEQDRKIWLGLDAASQAIASSKLDPGSLMAAPLFVGVSLEAFALERISPLLETEALELGANLATLQTPLDRLAQLLGNHYHLSAGRYTNCSACAAGAQVVGEAFWRVREGSAEVAIAGATDSTLNPLGLGGFSLLQIWSAENDRPEEACRPFDATRQGTVLSEGAAFLVLEELERARKRNAEIFAEVLGYGSSLDAFRVTDPEPAGQGAALSMTRAMADAGLDRVDCINAHGTGTFKNDIAETLGIKAALGASASGIPVTANKSMTGHMIATSGAAEAIASALTAFSRLIPPTRNLKRPDPRCDLDFVTGQAREWKGQTILSNSFGFGGQNASLIFARYEP
jgi:3-oxoacyl-[acyl-carrier-protein] synthase II